VGCRSRKPARATIRLVRSPEGQLLPDLYGKLPGRGVHLCPDLACFRQAVESNSFSRSFRAPTRVDDASALFRLALESSRDQVRAMLSTAVRSGWLLAGRTAVREALQTRGVALVLLAQDAQPALLREIAAGAQAENIPCHRALSVADLSRYHRGKPLAVLGIRHRGLARRLDVEITKEYALTSSAEKTNLEVVS
jgi:predicted RNA-binding protein YlxR (DUF448 family)